MYIYCIYISSYCFDFVFRLKSTPLLLASSSGALSAVKCLIMLGASIFMKDIEGNGIVHLSAMRLHTNVLEYLIESDYEEVPVWKILVGE